VFSDERGLSRAKNLGIRSSRLPFIAFLDDDCIPARDWVGRALELIATQPDSAVWIGKVVYDERELPCPERHEVFALRGIRDPWRHDPSGGNSFFRRSVFERVGPFDPLLGQGSTFPGAEDGDMIYRALKSGVGVTYSNTIRCFHIPWRAEPQKLDNRYNYGSGVGAMLAKHSRRGELVAIGFIFVRHFLKKFLLVPYHRLLGSERDYRRNLSYCRGLIDGFVGWRRLHQAGGGAA
jgi:GT2 family glycosyltransferase